MFGCSPVAALSSASVRDVDASRNASSTSARAGCRVGKLSDARSSGTRWVVGAAALQRRWFGVATGWGGITPSTIASSPGYNNNAWHLATATMSAAGTTLYIDGTAVATDPNLEGEATATCLARMLKSIGIAVTRLASGLPSSTSSRSRPSRCGPR